MKISITHIMKIVQLMDISNPIIASWLIENNLILKYNCDWNWIGNELPCMLIPKSIIGRCENWITNQNSIFNNIKWLKRKQKFYYFVSSQQINLSPCDFFLAKVICFLKGFRKDYVHPLMILILMMEMESFWFDLWTTAWSILPNSVENSRMKSIYWSLMCEIAMITNMQN